MKPIGKRLLVIWHGALYPSYRMPFWLLQTVYGWNVHLLACRRWSKALTRSTALVHADDEPIQLYAHPSLMRFHGATHIQPTLPYAFYRAKPDVVLIIEEPFSVMGWLSAYWCQRAIPKIPYLIYSYQNIYKRYPVPFRWMERYVLRHAERVLASQSDVGHVAVQKGFSKCWDVLPQAVNIKQFRYKEPTWNPHYFTVGYMGRLTDEKGIDILLWALSDLPDEVRLRLVGDGPARYKLENIARELGVYERIAFLGNVPHEQLCHEYHELDALVLPSITTDTWKEQFGRVLIEAMSCGVPVIGSDSGAIPEVIGNAGMVFPEGNDKLLADKIQMLHQDYQLRKNLSFKGRIRVEQEFSCEAVAKKLNYHLVSTLNSNISGPG